MRKHVLPERTYKQEIEFATTIDGVEWHVSGNRPSPTALYNFKKTVHRLYVNLLLLEMARERGEPKTD